MKRLLLLFVVLVGVVLSIGGCTALSVSTGEEEMAQETSRKANLNKGLVIIKTDKE